MPYLIAAVEAVRERREAFLSQKKPLISKLQTEHEKKKRLLSQQLSQQQFEELLQQTHVVGHNETSKMTVPEKVVHNKFDSIDVNPKQLGKQEHQITDLPDLSTSPETALENLHLHQIENEIEEDIYHHEDLPEHLSHDENENTTGNESDNREEEEKEEEKEEEEEEEIIDYWDDKKVKKIHRQQTFDESGKEVDGFGKLKGGGNFPRNVKNDNVGQNVNVFKNNSPNTNGNNLNKNVLYNAETEQSDHLDFYYTFQGN